MAGLPTVEALRAEGFAGRVTLVGDERHPPYSRPALSKQVLSGAWEASRALLTNAERLAALGIRYLADVRAEALDVVGRRVRIGDEWLAFSALVIATGLAARRVSGDIDALVGARERVASPLVLRTLDDALALAERFRTVERVTVLGMGILGCEIASVAAALGRSTALVGRGPRVAFGPLGELLGSRIERVLRDGGVDVRLGRPVAPGAAPGAGPGAGLVVAAIGSHPVVGWLHGSGLDLTDGVLCDESGSAAPGIYAVGDVARWRDPSGGAATRVEHQSSALAQGHSVARTIVWGSAPPLDAPFFWSEVLGTRILAHGSFPSGAVMTAVHGDLASARFVARVEHDGAETGLIGWNMPREFRAARAELHSSKKGTVVV
jgi:NADPH-dependent 2,4-dienoyl-CoA reductase/sulfur reductase-like enzyme